MKRKKKNSPKNSVAIQENIKLFPVIFAISIIPLLVRFTIYNPMLSDYSWFSASTAEGDFFTICKQSAMYFLDGLIILGLIQLALKKDLPRLKAFIPLLIYAILILFSTFVSVSPYHSLNGFYNMMESTGVLLGYCGICYYTYAVVKSEKHLKIIMFSLFLSIIIICAIGMTQMFGSDFLLSDIGKFFVFPSEYATYKDSIQQNFEGTVSSTLFNPNYVGVYTCIIIPILLTLTLTIKKRAYLILYFVLLALTLTILIGAGSKTALVTMIPCLIFLIFYLGKQIGRKMIPIMGVIIILIAGITIYQGDDSLLATTFDRLTAKSTVAKEFNVQNITLNDENYVIRFKDTDLTISYVSSGNEYSIIAINENGEVIPTIYSSKTERYRLDDSFYKGLYFKPLILNNTQIGYTILSQKISYNICYSVTDETYYYLNEYGRYTKLYRGEMVDLPIFRIMGGFSGRDYIWQYSLPVLKRTIFLGSGPDTYTFMFPQYDYVGKLQDERESLLITKPHNTYLQIGIQTGVLSLLAYLAFYILYFIDSAKLYFKRKLNSFPERCGAGIFIGSICYMLAGLLHDSTIGVSIVYWTLMGLGYACNRMIKETEKESIEFIAWSPKLKPVQIFIICIISTALLFAGHYVSNILINEPIDGRQAFATNALNTDIKQELSFQTSMSTEWHFENGNSPSSNAYVANPEGNQNSFYFEVTLSTGECIYSSSVLNVGQQENNISLNQTLATGDYTAVVTYHLLDENGSELGTAPVNILIKVLN